MVLLALASVPVLLFFAVVIVGILSFPDETIMVGRRRLGPWSRVPTWQAQAVVLTIMLPLAGVFLARLLRAEYRLWKLAVRTADILAVGLADGEIVAWRGKQGWRGFDRTRVVLIVLSGLGPACYALWLWRIWNGADVVTVKLLWTFFASVLLGGSVVAVLTFGWNAARVLVYDLLGDMVVTDRRLAWLTPLSGVVYREIKGADLVSAAFVEGTARRGWITVTERRRAEVSEIDILGVPQPARALSAIQQLIGA